VESIVSLLTPSTGPSLAARILDAFPSGSYALTGLLRLVDIVESYDVDTAAVECRVQPRMLVNPKFVERFAATPEKLLMLIMHELHHVLLGHTRLFPRVTRIDNLVFDAVINALLCRMFPAPEHTAFFTEFYDDRSLPGCLLRPPAGWTPRGAVPVPPGLEGEGKKKIGRLRGVFRALYSPAGAGYHELFDSLRAVLDEEPATSVVLLGDHAAHDGSSSSGSLDERSPLLFEAVREIVERWPQPPNPIAGRSLADLIAESRVRPVRQPSNRVLLARLLNRVGGQLRRDDGAFRGWREDAVQAFGPVPTADRRSLVLRALGGPPLLHRFSLGQPRRGPVGERVHVYLDVSGSIGNLKDALYGAVLDCRAFVHPAVHLFSTVVADVSLAALRRGECQSTGGTSIECVAAHMRTHNVRRALLVTDGYVGRPVGAHLETLARAKIGVALTPGFSTRGDLLDVADHWTEFCAREEVG
jgi:hypothetical protein